MLDVSALQSGMLNSMALGVVLPPAHAPSDVIALQMAAAINSYSMMAQTCAGTYLTVANFAGLQDGMKDALFGSSPDGQSAAEKWLAALEAYWATAAFGATGTVVTNLGGPVLVAQLAAEFDSVPDPPAVKVPGTAANAIASAIDAYTRAITAFDSAGPCGPSPLV